MISYEEYYPYGRSAYRAAASGVDLSLKRYRFTGKERDEETGLDYFGVRYYASWLGRWTSSDPGGFVDGLNLYRYVRNNPVNGVDKLGYKTEDPPPIKFPENAKKGDTYTPGAEQGTNWTYIYGGEGDGWMPLFGGPEVTVTAERSLGEKLKDIGRHIFAFAQGFSNAYLSDTLGTDLSHVPYGGSHGDAFYYGQKLGHLVAFVQGVYEMGQGIMMATGGTIATLGSGGTLALTGSAHVAVAGVAMAGHGYFTANRAAENLFGGEDTRMKMEDGSNPNNNSSNNSGSKKTKAEKDAAKKEFFKNSPTVKEGRAFEKQMSTSESIKSRYPDAKNVTTQRKVRVEDKDGNKVAESVLDVMVETKDGLIVIEDIKRSASTSLTKPQKKVASTVSKDAKLYKEGDVIVLVAGKFGKYRKGDVIPVDEFKKVYKYHMDTRTPVKGGHASSTVSKRK